MNHKNVVSTITKANTEYEHKQLANPHFKATQEPPRSRKGSLAVTVKVGTVQRKHSWQDYEVGGI